MQISERTSRRHIFEETGLRAQNLLTILGSIVNIIRGTYVAFLRLTVSGL